MAKRRHKSIPTGPRRKLPAAEIPLLELQQRVRQHMAAREQWATLVAQCKDLMAAGDKAEARKLLPEVERLEKLLGALEGKT